jgi:predicted helicase
LKVEDYLKELYSLFLSSSATEGSYYRALSSLLEAFKGIKTIILPKKSTGNFPDLKVVTKDGYIVGYAECKKVGADLLSLEESEQIKRYRKTFKNFLFTNFLEFRLYEGGKLLKKVELLPLRDFKKGNFKKHRGKELSELLKEFFSFSEKPITSLSELAESLSWRVRFLKEEFLRELSVNEAIKSLYRSIKEFVVETLTEEEFADTIAQSLAYGLLILRLKKGYVKKEEVILDFPKNLSVIREIFIEVLKVKDSELDWALSEVEQVLNLFDETKVKLTPEELTVHFYEPFLKAYNPNLREVRGVYYTPKEVVSFINRSVEEVLKESFKKEGFKDKEVTVLDPAAGTLTFILDIFDRLRKELQKEGSGIVKKFFEEVALSNFYAFELLPAPYVIGHLRASQFLKEIGIEDKRLKLYLTNTLEFNHNYPTYLFSTSWAEETKRADEVKSKTSIMVIVGNPPYSGISANNLKEIVSFLKEDVAVNGEVCQSYYKVGEKELKDFIKEVTGSNKVKVWLQDDYVKFIRFAQWKVCQNGKGVVGFITNHSYLDNPTFAGMRESLLKTFDRIYILNLHGNKRKKEPDENVFDIMQGVAVGIFVKDRTKEGEFGDVYYYSILNDEKLTKREEKLSFLSENSLKTVKWKRVNPTPPYYFFVPNSGREEWEKLVPINRIFEKFVSGIVTARDNLVIGFTQEEVKKKIETFLDTKISDEEIRKLFFKKRSSSKYPAGDTRSWKLTEARKLLRKELEGKEVETFIKPILYRPFDVRFIFYHPLMVDWDRREVMKHMLEGENIGLVCMNQVSLTESFSHSLVSKFMIDNRIFVSSKGIAYFFPLYLYKYKESKRAPNFTKGFREYIKELYGKELSPEEIFYYIYAVLYSPSYREKFGEFLKYEFPRIPFPKELKSFKELSQVGKKLCELHLLKDVSPSSIKLVGENFKVEKVSFKKNRVYINETTYFEPVEKEVFSYKIGGYQVLKKWLKDRKGRELSFYEIDTFRKVAVSLRETLNLQKLYG